MMAVADSIPEQVLNKRVRLARRRGTLFGWQYQRNPASGGGNNTATSKRGRRWYLLRAVAGKLGKHGLAKLTGLMGVKRV